jgi:hypothetical protein
VLIAVLLRIEYESREAAVHAGNSKGIAKRPKAQRARALRSPSAKLAGGAS